MTLSGTMVPTDVPLALAAVLMLAFGISTTPLFKVAPEVAISVKKFMYSVFSGLFWNLSSKSATSFALLPSSSIFSKRESNFF